MKQQAFTPRQTMLNDEYEMFYYIDQELPRITPHYHQNYEIYVYLGDGIDYQIGTQLYHLRKGDFLLIPPMTVHYPIYNKNATHHSYERLVLWYTTDWWHTLLEIDELLNYCFDQCTKRDSYLLRSNQATWQGLYTALCMAYNDYQQKKLCWNVACKASLITFFVHLNRTYYYQGADKEQSLEENILINDILKFIFSNIHQKLTLESIAKRFLISKSTLSHLFKERTGTSLYRYVIQRRLVVAKNNILAGIPISKAWENCGFNDYSTFYRAFTKEYHSHHDSF